MTAGKESESTVMKLMNFRRTALFSAFLLLMLCICSLCASAYAVPADETAGETVFVSSVHEYAAGGTAQPIEESELYRYLYKEIVSLSTEIYLTPYHTTQNELQEVYQALHRRPELFYTDSTYRIKLRDGNVVSIMPGYTMDAQTLITAQRVYTETLDRILACVSPEWTDYEKVLFLHDYLVTQYAYDEMQNVFDVYTFFTEGTGVCQAYSLTMCALLETLGIPNAYAVSLSMDHMWNLVQLDGAWYHLDVTWDDPVPEGTGFVCHTHFLCSDEKIRALEHYAWDAPYACTDTRYDNSFVHDVSSPFVPFDDGLWYYIESTTGILRTWNGDPSPDGCKLGKTKVQTVPWGSGKRKENGYFSGLVRVGDLLLYNSTGAVYAYHPRTNALESMQLSVARSTDTFCGITAEILPLTEDSRDLTVTGCLSDPTGSRYYSFNPTRTALYTVSGTLSGYFAGGSAQISLCAGGKTLYQTGSARGTSYRMGQSSFTLKNVRAGTYELVITAEGCFPVHISGFTVAGDIDLGADPRFADGALRELFTLLPGDLNADGVVDLSDRALLCAAGTFNRPRAKSALPAADINGDGYVDFLDLSILTSASCFGKTAASRVVQLG